MAVIKKGELKQLSNQQLKEKLIELKKELMKVNTKRASKTSLENPGQLKMLRKSIARILTKVHQNKKTSGGK